MNWDELGRLHPSIGFESLRAVRLLPGVEAQQINGSRGRLYLYPFTILIEDREVEMGASRDFTSVPKFSADPIRRKGPIVRLVPALLLSQHHFQQIAWLGPL
jgi:hypothetical protein